jgi:hypothetical protein
VVGSTITIVSESPMGIAALHLEQVSAKSGLAVLQCGQITMYVSCLSEELTIDASGGIKLRVIHKASKKRTRAR